MTIKEIIYNISNLKAGGVKSDDVKLSDEQYASIIHYYRAKLIRQEIDRGMKLDPMLVQPMLDVEVERVQFSRNEPLSGKTVYRTVKPIPRAISTKGSNLVVFVGDNLLGRAYQRSTATRVQFDSFRPYTGLNPKWFEFNDHIYVATEDSLTDIVIQLVAENPYRVLKFTNSIDVFDPFNYEYPISMTMLDTIFKLMLETELRVDAMGEDDINDGLDESSNTNNNNNNNSTK